MIPVPWKQWEGQVVDLYFPLRRYLGGTARSAVYLTQIGDPDARNAAIKLVLAEAQEPPHWLQWERAAQLSHPNVLRLFRTGRSQVNQLAVRYAVAEYAEENLAEVLAERPLAAAEVRDMLKPLLDALAYIHREGLVHGHLKPANIMAVGDDLKLSVDGITLVGEPGPAIVEPGPYDPPEFQERGCSPVGDVWSFGVTLVEALTQRLPVSRGVKFEPELPETLPAEFLPMVRACLRPDPRRRASLAEILELFARPAAAVPVEVPVEPPAAPRKRMNVTLAAAAVALAAIVVGPRLLRRPVASAQTQQAPIVPASVPVSAAPVIPQEPKPTPFVAPRAEKPTLTPPPAATVPAVPKDTATAPPRAVETPAGDVVHQVMPEIPDYARRTIRGMVKIEVRAKVDASGRVTSAAVQSQNSKYFAKLTLDAARRWQFTGAPGEWLLRFEFTTSSATVRPTRAAR